MPMMPRCDDREVRERVSSATRLLLFLDYDGTLAEFAPTPENPTPDERVIRLLQALVASPRIRVTIVSGRRLDHLETLVPVDGLALACTYGIELRDEKGRQSTRLAFGEVRPGLEALKPGWAALLEGRSGFFLEDKGWSLALHARFADAIEAETVLARARALAEPALSVARGAAPMQLLDGHKFLEIAPAMADKGLAVAQLLAERPWEGSLPIYVGDDDKDEKAFATINDAGGLTVVVTRRPRATLAHCRLPSPRAARAWLTQLAG